MKKIVCSIIVLLCCSQFVTLADDCSEALNEAKTLYNSGDYAKAKSLFEYVKSECGSSYSDATNWIAKCDDALTPRLSLSRTSISVGAFSGSTTITVTSNRTWELRNTSSSMFSVSKSGNTITIQNYSNSSTSSRNDYFDVVTTDGSKSVRVNVYQSGKAATPSLSVSKTSISAGASGITEHITVTCNTTWEVQYPSGTMYSVTRSGNSLTVKINANSSTESRSDYFNVRTTDGSKVQKIQLTQGGGATLSVSKTSISAGASGITEHITVTCNTTWEVQYPSGTMYSVTRSGNSLTVKINANSSTESRSDYFNVRTTDGSKVQKIQLTQGGGATLSVSKTSISCSAGGTTEYITVTSSKPWEVQYPSGTMYSVTRSGNTLTVKILPNSSTESRSDYFNVKTTDGSKVQKIELKQTGKSYSSISPKAKIHKVWAEHNVMYDGKKCMEIHVKFEVDNMKGKTGRVTAYFYTDSGTALTDYNSSYRTTSGKVSVGEDFTPSYDNSIWNDFVLYIPNSELHITNSGDYKFFVNIWSHNSDDLAESDWVSFTYGK